MTETCSNCEAVESLLRNHLAEHAASREQSRKAAAYYDRLINLPNFPDGLPVRPAT